MRLRSLKSKLLLFVSVLVISSGLLIALLVNRQYSRSLYETMTAQTENLAHAAALESVENILTRDLVALQKTLQHYLDNNAAVAYIFILRKNRILAHTFTNGVPADLIEANKLTAAGRFHLQKIVSTGGEYYLDIAWPIFNTGSAVLRLGVSQKYFRSGLTRLWLKVIGLTLGILFVALTGSIFFVRRITHPLAVLVRGTQKIEQGELGVRVDVQGQDEVAELAVSFNHMMGRMEAYTRKLEEQTLELERAYNQTRTFCGIVQEIGSMRNLNEIGAFMIKKFQLILKCNQIALLIFNSGRDVLFVLSERGARTLNEPETLQAVEAALAGLKKVTFTKNIFLKTDLIPDDFQSAQRKALVPLQYENDIAFGALLIGCPGDCRCHTEDFDMAGVILTQSAGVIKRALVQEEELRHLRHRFEIKSGYSGIVGKDSKMQTIYKLIENIAPTDATVLIQGESGTGKELVARAIHANSPRSQQPFMVINCSAYPETLLESELFGHEKGAFTGAIQQKIGRFEKADGGSVFLDEIGEISPSAQIRLLRVLQTQKFERVGGEKTLHVNVRILAATNKDLFREVEKGSFREDLIYRLNVIPIQLPPLRDRHNDIPLLAQHFLRHFAEKLNKQIDDFSPEAMRLLLEHSWPGNVRELENSIEHAAVLARGRRIEAANLPKALQTYDRPLYLNGGLAQSLAEHEKKILLDTLEKCGLNKKLAARRLGISRNTLYIKLKKYKIVGPATP